MNHFARTSIRQSLSNLSVSATVRGADLALRIPRLRDAFIDALLERLSATYESKEPDRVKLMHQRWLGEHLAAFLHRLTTERPAAARAILRFLGAWIVDMSRRAEAQGAQRVAPCTVVIEPTDRCNLRCPGCYAKSTGDGSDLEFERLAEIVEQVVQMGVTLVTISGGEPFLRERKDRALSRLAERFGDRGFLVYTNGTLIDEPVADRLGRLGNIFPAISVEGFEHQTDARRGRGIYQENRRARQMLAARGVMAGFSATVTRENAEAIASDDFIDLRIEEGDMFGWFFLLQPIGRAPRPDLMVTAQQRAMLREAVYRWRRQNRPIFLGDFWNDGHLVGGCIAGGRYYFHLYANGDISPCVFAPVACGNIFDIIQGKSPYKSLEDFVQRHPLFVAFREAQEQIKDRNRPCLLIDHPEVFRRLCSAPDCRPAKNMAAGYLDGEIARHLDRVAAEWERFSAALPPLPAELEAQARRASVARHMAGAQSSSWAQHPG